MPMYQGCCLCRSELLPAVGLCLTSFLLQGKSEMEVRHTAQLFDDMQSVVESKQLVPMLYTQVRIARRQPVVVRGQ